MAFSGQVGETFYLKDNPKFRHRYVILTSPNLEKVAVANFTDSENVKEKYCLFSPRHWIGFQKDTTIQYTDARLLFHKEIINHAKQDPDNNSENCPLDIVREIVIGAFKAKLSSNEVLQELAREYPDLYKAHY